MLPFLLFIFNTCKYSMILFKKWRILTGCYIRHLNKSTKTKGQQCMPLKQNTKTNSIIYQIIVVVGFGGGGVGSVF